MACRSEVVRPVGASDRQHRLLVAPAQALTAVALDCCTGPAAGSSESGRTRRTTARGAEEGAAAVHARRDAAAGVRAGMMSPFECD